MRRLSAAANAEVLALRRRRGSITPEEVIAFAADENTALHAMFEWDDSEAARQHRISQARLVLRMTIEVVREYHEPIRAFVSLSTDRGTGGGYRRMRDVMNDPEARAVLLQDALAELRMYQAKYAGLRELDKLWDAAAEIEAEALKPTKKHRRKAA